MEVGGHAPEAAKRRRGQADAELRQVALEEGADELSAPRETPGIARSEERPREPTPQPADEQRLGTRVLDVEAAELPVGDAPREGFARLAQQLRAGGAEDQEPRRIVRPIEQDAERRKEFGPALDLVEYHQPPQGFEGAERILEARNVASVLEIESGYRAREALGELPGKRRLADLARPENGDRGKSGECRIETPQRAPALQHGGILLRKSDSGGLNIAVK